MEYIASFLVSVMARTLSHVLCKWVDRYISDRNPK